jgi:guanine deaminase
VLSNIRRYCGTLFLISYHPYLDVMRCYTGFIVNPLPRSLHHSAYQLAYIPDGAMVVSDTGKILFVGTDDEARAQFPASALHSFPEGTLLMPGLVDTHVHLPQYEAAAIGTGELLDWLNTYIFPLEVRFADDTYAREKSARFFRDALSLGTTTMSVYCSSQRNAAERAFEAAFEAGIRVCMGKTMMDFGAPENILFSAQENIEDSLAVAKLWHEKDGGRLQYTLTPRFAGSCSRELLRRTGDVARAEGLRIQTHLSENPSELRYIAELFPEYSSYTDVYFANGILTERTIMAHSIYLSEQEKSLLKAHQCSLSHCPCSNRFLQSGVMALRKNMREGFKIGLGSDVAGGYSLSILNEAKEAAESSKTWNILHRGEEVPAVSAQETLWLATLGGAEALGLDSIIGNFTVGKEADFIAVAGSDTFPHYSSFDAPSERIARLVYGAHRDTVFATFVRGKQVFTRS